MSATEITKSEEESNQLAVSANNAGQASANEGDESDSSSESEQRDVAQFAKNFEKYNSLPISPEIKELFKFVTMFIPQSVQLQFKLKPFKLEYMPAIGQIDAFLKIRRPDKKPSNLGYTVLDEPSSKQSDTNAFDLQLRTVTKTAEVRDLEVKNIKNAHYEKKAITNWIENVSNMHKGKPPTSVLYKRSMPDTDLLMQEWPTEVEHLLSKINVPTAELNCTLEEYVDVICNILDIPVYQNRIQSLHVLFSLFTAFRDLTDFQAAAAAAAASKSGRSTFNFEQGYQVNDKGSEINFLSAGTGLTADVLGVSEKSPATAETSSMSPSDKKTTVSVSVVFGKNYPDLFEERLERKQKKTIKSSFVESFFNDDKSYLESSEVGKKVPISNAKQKNVSNIKAETDAFSGKLASRVSDILKGDQSSMHSFNGAKISTHSIKSDSKPFDDDLRSKDVFGTDDAIVEKKPIDIMTGEINNDLLAESQPEEVNADSVHEKQIPSDTQKISDENEVSPDSNDNNIGAVSDLEKRTSGESVRKRSLAEKKSLEGNDTNSRPPSAGAGAVANKKVETSSIGSRRSATGSLRNQKIEVGSVGSKKSVVESTRSKIADSLEVDDTNSRPPSAGTGAIINKKVETGSFGSRRSATGSLRSQKLEVGYVSSKKSVVESTHSKMADSLVSNDTNIRPPSAGAGAIINEKVEISSLGRRSVTESLRSQKIEVGSVSSKKSVAESIQSKKADGSKRTLVEVSNSKKFEAKRSDNDTTLYNGSKQSFSDSMRNRVVSNEFKTESLQNIERKLSTASKKSTDFNNAEKMSLNADLIDDERSQEKAVFGSKKSIESTVSKRTSIKSTKFDDNASQKIMSSVGKRTSLGGSSAGSKRASAQLDENTKMPLTEDDDIARFPGDVLSTASKLETPENDVSSNQRFSKGSISSKIILDNSRASFDQGKSIAKQAIVSTDEQERNSISKGSLAENTSLQHPSKDTMTPQTINEPNDRHENLDDKENIVEREKQSMPDARASEDSPMYKSTVNAKNETVTSESDVFSSTEAPIDTVVAGDVPGEDDEFDF